MGCIVGTSLTKANESNKVKNGSLSAKAVQGTLSNRLRKYSFKKIRNGNNQQQALHVPVLTFTCLTF